MLNQVVQRDNWEPDDISDSRLWMERFVLYSFYEAGGGDGWNLNFGWRNPDLGACDWFGVTCDSSDRVISLLSQFNSLEGSLPSELGLLEELTQIGLRKYRMAVLMVFIIANLTLLASCWTESNRLSGNIPAALGNLRNLERLDLRT